MAANCDNDKLICPEGGVASHRQQGSVHCLPKPEKRLFGICTSLQLRVSARCQAAAIRNHKADPWNFDRDVEPELAILFGIKAISVWKQETGHGHTKERPVQKPIPECVPSQNGFSAEPPHLQSLAALVRATTLPVPAHSSSRPETTSGPSCCGLIESGPLRTVSASVDGVSGSPVA